MDNINIKNIFDDNYNLTKTGYQQGFYNNTGGGGAASAWTGRYIALGN